MRPIFLSEEAVEELLEEVKKKMSKTRMFDGNFEFKYVYELEHKRPHARLLYTASAWAKMKQLVLDFESEVGWHGVVHRQDDHTFVVTDILVYPQTVTGATVTTDEDEYHNWLTPLREALAEDPNTNVNFHGHSHVNFAVTPSSVDIKDQKEKMESTKKGFWIFTIHNKKDQSNTWIYDYDNNIMYDNNEIDQEVILDSGELFAFMEDSKNLVKTAAASKKPATYNYSAPNTTEKKKDYDDWKAPKDSPYLPGYYPYGDARYDQW